MKADIIIKGIDFEIEVELFFDFGLPDDEVLVSLKNLYFGNREITYERHPRLWEHIEDRLFDLFDIDEAVKEHELDCLLYWEDLNEY